ncbi:hypothetical protein KI688_000707 [Linnemannia hyalina]|uniref:FAD-binding domain-containing protein n=1 Tax=Linnemannia hyalina TaxID=64524 RepID=A0A9P8BYX5_9FUNG|nr:hypothetical protein KI688_000707 [Linnemannia hyalina]
MSTATTTDPQHHILIVGAGLGGLMLGASLERCNIPYTIFERASTVKPLGSALSVGGQIMPVFEQLGLYEKYVDMAKPFTMSTDIRESGESLPALDLKVAEDMCGYSGYIVARPLLYDLLLSQIPKHKILFNKRVLTISEKEEKVTIQTSDNFIYEGGILVGADGAYSAVRQRLYDVLKKEGKLPKSDQEDLPFNCTCLVGQTEPLDVDKFPQLKDPKHPFINTLGDNKPFTNSEWGPHAAQTMCDQTRDFPIPFGNGKLTLGDMYDMTPKDQISKVMLEEKIFKTWYHGRTVLLGDACHKLHPSGGQGAITAMHDAIALANLIYALPTNTSKDIEHAFEEYKAERLPPVIEAAKGSQLLSLLLNRGFLGTLALLFLKYMPRWLWLKFVEGIVANRPTLGFLSEVENKGSKPASVSPSTEKARKVYNKSVSAAAAV